MEKKTSKDSLQDQLVNTLEIYERKIQNTKDSKKIDILNGIIDGLRLQMGKIGKSKPRPSSKDPIEVIYDRNLKEIFKHYACLQYTHLQNNSLFDGALDASNRMSIGEWMKFCSDFGITKIVDEIESERQDPDRVKFRTSAVQVPF